jgi:hypothetical protein
MSGAGLNMATTQNGEKYNKLKRPDDLLASMPPPPEVVPALQSSTQSAKRTLDEAGITAKTNDEHDSKRARAPNGVSRAAGQHAHTLFKAEASNVWRPFNMQCGMQAMFPVDDDDMSDESMNEALAYLRSVRSVLSFLAVFMFHTLLP